LSEYQLKIRRDFSF